MSNQKEPNLKEGMGMKDKYDFGEIEQKVDELDKKINTPYEGDKDQEEPLTTVGRKIDRMLIRPERMSIKPPLTSDEKIKLINCLFPITLGDRVRNKLTEDGIVEMVGIDYRGVLYLVLYKDQTSRWESEAQIEKTEIYGGPGPDKVPDNSKPYVAKTDIPDPKTVKRGDRESKLE